MSGQLGFYLRQDRCIGCATCQVACKDKKDLDVGQLFRRVREVAGGGYTKVGNGFTTDVYAYWLSIACNHCQKPVCVKNCPTGAMQKRAEDGIVFVDQNRCIGCQICVRSCPYQAPQYNPKLEKVGKCDLCKDLLANGDQPVCVSGCPMRVLECGRLDQLQKKYGTVNKVKGLPDPARTKPSLVITPHHAAAE